MTPPRPGVPRDQCPATRHGNAYAIRDFGCNCEDALELRRQQMADYRKRRYLARGRPLRVSRVGATRRMQALAWMGWTQRELETRIGSRAPRVGRLTGAYDNIAAESHAWWRTAFDRFALERGPSSRIRSTAITRGYAPPLAWENIDDPKCVPEIADSLLEQGRRQRYLQRQKNREQRRRRLADAGYKPPPKDSHRAIPTVTAYRKRNANKVQRRRQRDLEKQGEAA